ncbi:hypothetical protein B0T10DRAFT_611236 [Thelonectria olida]|uniref:Zn(2)-C6 fungal-type domain-containing protein n=1 Tax=Thelonectria olida TaxID=1576542 RepID=A0A9P8VSM4_9HYPO|nr:hypothetical protein B0T10DRAFT_611236 [Thelonectria olida]
MNRKNSSNNPKRPSQSYSRSRRIQYVNQACNECKRRKIRCDGANPCGKCVRSSVPCLYVNNHRAQKAATAVLASSDCQSGGRIAQKTDNVGAHSVDMSHRDEAHAMLERQTSQTSPRGAQTFQSSGDASLDSPEFCGPSSSEFTLNVVSGSLRAMGMPAAILDKSNLEAGTSPSTSSRLAQYGPFMKLLAMDPLWDTRRKDAIDLIEQWCEATGTLYPVVSREKMLETANDVFGAMDNAQNEGAKVNRGSLIEALFTDETSKMKIVMAIGRTVESGGRNDQAQRLFQSITEAVEGLLWNTNSISGIQLLVLAALYYYHLDEEVRTGRIIGFAARLCLEMGLHRRVTVESTFPNLEDRSTALRTFWCVYMLERRTSLGQGIPFSIQDSYVDPSLFSLCNFGTIVSALLDWTKLAGRTWHALNSQGEKEAEINMDELKLLDYQVKQWYEQLPKDLRLDRALLQKQVEGTEETQTTYFQAVLFLRKSHLQNLIYRPVLRSAARITQHERYAFIATDFAKEALQTLTDLNETTSLIRTWPLFFKHLLLTAFGNLLLVIVNASSTFADSIRAEFEIALDLIKLLSTRSPPLVQIWKRLQGLRELQARLFNRSLAEVSSGSASSHIDYSSDALLFDELFPALPLSLGVSSGGTELQGDFAGTPLVREHLNTLFDFPVGSSNFFNSPFVGWE